jgi:hypothetical protein
MANVTIDDAQLAALIAQAVQQALAASQPVQPAPVQTSTGAHPMIGGQAVRIDAAAVTGDPNTIVAPKTGHVLPLCLWDQGEGIAGYALRCAHSLLPNGGPNGQDPVQFMVNNQGAILMMSPALRDGDAGPGVPLPTDGAHSIPLRVDKFANPRAYMTPDELAADDKAQAAWTAEQAAMQAPGARQLSVHYPEFDQYKPVLQAYISGISSGNPALQAQTTAAAEAAVAKMGVSFSWAINYFSNGGGGF